MEILGFGYGHQRVYGLIKDCERMRVAVLLGWTVIPFTAACIQSAALLDEAIHYTRDLLEMRGRSIEWRSTLPPIS